MENEMLQDEAEQILSIQAQNHKITCRAFRFPYFFDEQDRLPPPSEEKVVKDRLGIRNLSLSKKWVAKDLLRLEESVFVSVKRQVVSRLLAKKAKLEEQLETCENSDVNSELLRISEQLNEIQNMRKIDLLRKYRNNERVDWLCIAVIDFAGRRGDRDLELIWENLVWPNISLPQWDNVNLTKMDEMIKNSPSYPPDWEAIAAACNKHVVQCWELYLGQKNQSANILSDGEVWQLYSKLRTRDYVPWLRIGKELNTFSQVRVTRRIEAAACRMRCRWRLEDDVLLLLSIYLYRGMCNWSQVSRCMRTHYTARTAGQAAGRIEYLLGATSLQTAIRHLEKMKASDTRVPLPIRRCKQTMIPWMLSALISVMSKVQMSVFYKDDCVGELQRVSLKVARNIYNLIDSSKRSLAVSDRLDHQISQLLAPQAPLPKPVRFPGGEVIFPLMQSVIEKKILGMDSEPVTAGPSFTVVEKRIEAVAELERAIECGLLMSTTSSLSAAQVFIENLKNEEEPLDPTVISWIEEQIENEPAFADFEKHFNAVFTLPFLMTKIEVPEVKPMVDFDDVNTKKKRKDISFRRKRGSKKPWIKARWDKHRQDKLKAELTEAEVVPVDIDVSVERADEEIISPPESPVNVAEPGDIVFIRVQNFADSSRPKS